MPRYSETDKAEVLALVDEIGAKKASEQKKVAYQTVLAWRNKRDAVDVPEDSSEPTAEEPTQLSESPQEGGTVTTAEQLRDSQRQIAALLAENERLKDAIDALMGRKS